jgi:hypothetical protein
MKYAPKGFNEVDTEDPEATAGRETSDLCPRQRAGFHVKLSQAARCYGCRHLFDPLEGKSDVLCPCCA